MNLTSLSEHELLVFWVQMVVLLVAARGLGGVAKRVGQPAVVGELAAGLVLGPSVLGRLWPGGFDWLVPADEVQSAMLLTVGWLGVVFLVFATGYETDLTLIATRGRAAFFVSTGSLVVPIFFGLIVGFWMPETFLGAADARVVFALFMAAALSISSLPVIAKIMTDMGLMRRDFGQLTLAAGMANDVVGWLLLGVIAGLATAGSVSVAPVLMAVLGMAVFVGLSFTVGQRLVDAALRRVLRQRGDLATNVSVVVAITLIAGSITQWLGVEAVIGAFVAGIVIGRSRFNRPDGIVAVEGITNAFLAPIFFATAGLRVDLGLLWRGEVFLWAVVVVAVASLAKFTGAWAGARLARLPNKEGLALGAGLNARGALEIVIATVGLSLGVLNQSSYTVVVLMAVATSMLAPPTLRWIVRSWAGSEQEQERIRREQALSRNVIVGDKRLLLPTAGGANSLVAAQIADLVWPTSAGATLMSMTSSDIHLDLRAIEEALKGREVTVVDMDSASPAGAIAEEAALNYGAVIVGALDARGSDRIVSGVVDELLRISPVPVVIARRARHLERPTPMAFARALVPVTGSNASRAAQEIAFSISAAIGTQVSLLHVVHRASSGNSSQTRTRHALRRSVASRAGSGSPRDSVAQALVGEATERASEVGARVQQLVRDGVSIADEIVEASKAEGTDLVVVGARPRRVGGHVFLGDVVEEILDRCDATVVVVALPESAVEEAEAENGAAAPGE